ncbi:MAG: metal-dependent transcriptional regulator [Pseudomonadota bacterium]
MKPTPKKTYDDTLTSTMEDYLETIFDLDQDKKYVRVKDIAKRLKVKMPTVTSMLKTLDRKGMINYEKYEFITLTSEGTKVGEEMRKRHEIMRRFLSEVLKVDIKTADDDACKIEHALSVTTLDSLTDFIEFIYACPRAGESWLNHFEEFRLHGHQQEKCEEYTKKFICDFSGRLADTDEAKEPKKD